MTESPAARPSGRDELVRHEASQNYELAQNGGGWMVGAGFAIAFVWIFAAAGMAWGTLGPDGLSLLPSIVLASGVMGILVPALMMILAGFMARTNRRSAAANALVMESAVRLMAPAREAGTEGITFAEQMKQAAAEIDKAMAHALAGMKAMSGELGDERLRLESVAYATADNARELAQRLAGERAAMETLARDLKGQMDAIGNAIPRQAQMMVEASRQAGEEVGRADEALEQRLSMMHQTADTLRGQLEALDGLARETAIRSEELTFAVTRVEERLEQSRKTVDAAIRSGEVAAAAAITTGDSLKDAVSAATDDARRAHQEINQATRRAAEEAARALARLREAGEQTANTLRNVERLADAETARVSATQHPRLSAYPQHRDPPPVIAKNGFDADETPHHDTSALNGSGGADPDPIPMDDDLFDAKLESLRSAAFHTPSEPEEMSAEDLLEPEHEAIAPPDDLDHPFDAPDDGLPSEPPTNGAVIPVGASTPPTTDMGWRDIISDMSREDTPHTPDREDVAEQLINRLQTSGIELPRTFRPKAKRKIAQAARTGEQERRTAILSQAGKHVDRVSKRLKNDRELMQLARDFVSLEANDALAALEQTHNTGRNASPRLAAYLLLDAAFRA